MRPQFYEEILVTLLRQCYSAQKCQPVRLQHFAKLTTVSLRRTRQYGTTSAPVGAKVQEPMPSGLRGDSEAYKHHGPYLSDETPRTSSDRPRNIAVLGGGITGLACAFYLSKFLPLTGITLYEASDRMGGWLRSKHVDVGNGKVVFEQGPRNLRPRTPAGLVTLELIKLIGLEDEIITTSKTSVSAQSRFIYYPDHLVQMPGAGQHVLSALWRILTEPVFAGALTGLAGEVSKPRRSPNLEDESVGSFLERRLGNKSIGDNLVSAILHGVYGGDLYQLSAKTLMPRFWHMERMHGNFSLAVTRDLLYGLEDMREKDARLIRQMVHHTELAGGEELLNTSVYSFKQGIEALADGIIGRLKENRKISLKMGKKVENITLDNEAGNVKISIVGNQPPCHYDRVISTISSRALSQLTNSSSGLPSLSETPAVTVMVVNLHYSNPALLPVHGFGYLIPRSVPWDQNPERALGVVFDSDANVGQDTAPGTKVTVMLGGHWWDGWASYPDEAEGVAMAKAILRRHLKVEEEPDVINVGIHRECIPQYTVGHDGRMKKAHSELMTGFKGKLAVAGSSYTGVGLNDCVKAAREVADAISRPGSASITGLESFTSEASWLTLSRKALYKMS